MTESVSNFGSPRRVRYQIELPEAKTKALAAWLDELPLANLFHCFDAVEAVLEYFNGETAIPGAARLEMAELLNPKVALLVGQCEGHFMDAALPYHPKAEFYAGVAFRLQYGLGMAYALAAADLKPAQGWFGHGGQQTLKAVHRALQHLGLAQLRVAQQYLSLPMDYWGTWFRLYRHAEAHKLLLSRFDSPGEPDACKTPLGLFKRGLLFYLAGTRHLRQRDMARIYDLLGQWADHAEWRPEASQGWHSAEFMVYLDGDCPPSRSLPGGAPQLRGIYFLYTLGLARVMAELAEEAGTGLSGDRHPIDESVLSSVARNLEGIQKRRADRKVRDRACHCVVGLNKLIAALAPSGSDAAEAAIPVESDPSAKLARRLGLILGRDLDNEDADLRSEITLPRLMRKGGLSRDEIWTARREEEPETAGDRARVEGRIANVGVNDYCIVWPLDQVAEIKVGEVIGVSEPGQPLFIGVIRWLHCGEGRVRFGVERLTLCAEVVELLDQDMQPMARGLLLPPEPGFRGEPELLALPGKTHPGGMVRQRTGEGSRLFRAYTLLKNAASFSRFAMIALQ
ncbi:hypothetical protein SAMN02949497_2685 [Methylomagnum ishizawai]|uniref:Uncharacterized protein n=1 Tax=Methylomagnum ishizawai TaxID=1760988 RepID=A0A1Y6D5W4_9GAMM|nr:hypothetical protein [Methylomagnum ishizawai]SMF95325.1 hypothetical protein SAMN02949497_2685 [Methylomagnum ishizawai]